jgi:hypothetical protein
MVGVTRFGHSAAHRPVTRCPPRTPTRRQSKLHWDVRRAARRRRAPDVRSPSTRFGRQSVPGDLEVARDLSEATSVAHSQTQAAHAKDTPHRPPIIRLNPSHESTSTTAKLATTAALMFIGRHHGYYLPARHRHGNDHAKAESVVTPQTSGASLGEHY